MQQKLALGNDERTVNFAAKPYGGIVYRFTAMSKAKKPIAYIFEGTVEPYAFDRTDDSGVPHFHLWKASGEGVRHWSSWSVRDRWPHVCKFIVQAVLPAAREWSKTDDYRREHVAAMRASLVRELESAQRAYEHAVRQVDVNRDSVAGAEAKLASFDERHGALQ